MSNPGNLRLPSTGMANGARTMLELEALKEELVGPNMPQLLFGKLMPDEGKVPVTNSGYAHTTTRSKGQEATVVCGTRERQ